jgi:hypothetical protein
MIQRAPFGALFRILTHMPYKTVKQDCTRSDGKKGKYILKYKPKKRTKKKKDSQGFVKAGCHTSKKNAADQRAAIEGGPRRLGDSPAIEEAIRTFVRSVLLEETQSLYAMGLEDGHAGKNPEMENMQEYMRGYRAGREAHDAFEQDEVPYTFQPTD